MFLTCSFSICCFCPTISNRRRKVTLERTRCCGCYVLVKSTPRKLCPLCAHNLCNSHTSLPPLQPRTNPYCNSCPELYFFTHLLHYNLAPLTLSPNALLCCLSPRNHWGELTQPLLTSRHTLFPLSLGEGMGGLPRKLNLNFKLN